MDKFPDDVPRRRPGRPRKTTPTDTPRKPVDIVASTTTTWGLENLEPGDNSKFLRHAMIIRQWPLIDITNPAEVENRISEYFALCAADDIKPSVKGFLNALRVSRSTLWEWKNGNFRAGTHQAIICEAYDVLEALWEDYMQNGKINPVSGIFLGKNNFGYADKQEYVLTPNNNGIPEPQDVKAIEEKYAELPED